MNTIFILQIKVLNNYNYKRVSIVVRSRETHTIAQSDRKYTMEPFAS